VPLAARFGLVRPLQGRYVAGVGAALGRATRTDPVLWRVVLAVLVCFGGVGALLYLLAWLLTPEEGDDASPAESLLGRGHSSTSPVITVVLGLVATALLVFVLPRALYVVLGGAVVLAALILIKRPPVPTTPPVAPPPPGPPPPTPPTSWPTVGTSADTWAQATAPPPPAPPVSDAPPAGPAMSDAPPVTDAPPPAGWAYPATSPTTAPPQGAGYRPAFAPRGPFGGPPPPPPPPPPRPRRERSRLPAIIFFATLLAVGGLGIYDSTAPADIPVAGYLATGLAVVGGGLLVGAWLGRARGMIALGCVLALALPVADAVDAWEPPEYVADEFAWTPASTAEIEDEYAMAFGSGRLDLRQADFTGQDVTVAVDLSFGDMEVMVPADVAVAGTVRAQFGDATVFGDDYSGAANRQTIQYAGSGDPEAGTLHLDLNVRFGSLEVRR
jgi:phage shock protein PspC (stress-responsive transcriptional regulator)